MRLAESATIELTDHPLPSLNLLSRWGTKRSPNVSFDLPKGVNMPLATDSWCYIAPPYNTTTLSNCPFSHFHLSLPLPPSLSFLLSLLSLFHSLFPSSSLIPHRTTKQSMAPPHNTDIIFIVYRCFYDVAFTHF